MSTEARALLGLKAAGLAVTFEPGADHGGSFSATRGLSLGNVLNNYLSLTKKPPTTHAGTATIPAPAEADAEPHPLYFPKPPALSNVQSMALVTHLPQFQGIYIYKYFYLYLLPHSYFER